MMSPTALCHTRATWNNLVKVFFVTLVTSIRNGSQVQVESYFYFPVVFESSVRNY